MKNFFLCYLLVQVSIIGISQNISVSIAGGIDTVENINRRNIVQLWNNYLNSNPDSIYDNKYWNNDEKRRYVNYDLLNSTGYLSPSLYGLVKGWHNIILSITPRGGDVYVIESLFYAPYENGNIYPFARTKYIAKKENGYFKLYNYLPFVTRDWYQQDIGYFKYCYYPEYPFDKLEAQRANDFYRKVCDAMSIEPDTIFYYIFPNCNTIFKYQGYDYVIGMGGEVNNCGFFDYKNYIIYTNCKAGEMHKHEILHYLLTHYKKSGRFHLGIVIYWGDSLGQSFQSQLKRVNEFLKLHPEINLNDFEEFNYIDDYTNPQYVIPAVFCHLALEQGGIEKLKQLFSYDDTFVAIEKMFNIKQNKLNKFLRNKIDELSKNIKIIEP